MIEEEIVIEEENQEEQVEVVEENQEEQININEESVNINITEVYDKNYIYIQGVASDEWVINHNLEKYPSVSVIDSSGSEVIGDVEHIDANNLKIKFAGGFSGKATLN